MSFLSRSALSRSASPSDQAAARPKSCYVAVILLLCWSSSTSSGAGDSEKARSLAKESGFISHLAHDRIDVRRIELIPPVAGGAYEIKVNFLKAETFGSLIDDYFDSLSGAERVRGKTELEIWRRVQPRLLGVRSQADFRVLDAEGQLIQEVVDIGSLTWGRTVKLTADSPLYTVEIRCVQGAGLFHLSFESD